MRATVVIAASLALAACVPAGRDPGTLAGPTAIGDGGAVTDDAAGGTTDEDAGPTAARDDAALPSGPDASTPGRDAGTPGRDAAPAPDAAPPVGPCPAPPAGSSPNAALALARANEVRAAMGVGCATMDTAINTAAERHCHYYATNRGTAMCVANAHEEVMGCPEFVAASFATRMRAAGYQGAPAFENMHFIGNGAAAIDGWIDSVWHRTPVLSPWITTFGYGSEGACDTADYGAGGGAPASTVAVYPYDGQSGVPTSFDGRREGPNPPAPPTGWPSGYPIHVYAQSAITEHTITADGQAAPLDHVWLEPGSQALLRTEYVLYTHAPLAPGTRYQVHVRGPSVDRTWSFTTR